MKKVTIGVFIIGVIMFLMSSCAAAQIVQFNYIKWKNEDVRQMIERHTPQLQMSLSRTGFNENDTIKVWFHYSMGVMFVEHQLTDQKKIAALYRNVVVLIHHMNHKIRFHRLNGFNVYVLVRENKYWHTEFDSPDLSPQRTNTIEDRLIARLDFKR